MSEHYQCGWAFSLTVGAVNRSYSITFEAAGWLPGDFCYFFPEGSRRAVNAGAGRSVRVEPEISLSGGAPTTASAPGLAAQVGGLTALTLSIGW